MEIDFSVKFDFRDKNENISLQKIIEHFSLLVRGLNNLSNENQDWYETGYSKKQALSHIAFKDGNISNGTLAKWRELYKKDYPLFIDSVWDGKSDYSSDICYRKMFYDDINRVNVELNFVSQNTAINMNDIIYFVLQLACYFDCSYINIESKGYRFLSKNVFPDRLSVGWMLYSPSIILPELIPQAAKVIPVIDGENRKGTIVVSTEEFFDGSKKEHIIRSNNLEIRLLDLGLLPLLAEI
ncbi:immunity 52 family protein [Salmonella enterica subsp. enterica]